MAEATKAEATKTPRVKVATKSTDVKTGSVTFTFTNGKALTVKVTDFPKEIQAHLAVHGMAAKIGDTYASAARDAAESGQDAATVGFTMASGEVAKLMSGKWIERTAGGSVKYLDLVEPLIAVRAKAGVTVTREKVIAWLSDQTAGQLLGLRQNPDVIAAMATLAKGRKDVPALDFGSLS